MKSKWWNSSFTTSYDTFIKSFRLILVISFCMRMLTTILYSYEKAFGDGELFKFMLMLTINILALFFRNFDNKIKKLVMYSLVEMLNVGLRFHSLETDKSEAILFCLESTLFTLLLQSNIFQSMTINFLIALKHLFLWFIIDENINIPKNVTSLMISLVILGIWSLFEKDKRSNLLETFLAKKAERKTLKELSNLIQIFPQGLLILTKDFNVHYQNDIISILLKGEKVSEFLNRNILENKSKSLLQKIKEITLDSVSNVSLGLSDIDNSIYEWSLKLVVWKKSMSYMITAKDVTRILKFERVCTENKTKTELIRTISHELRTPINGITLIIDDILNEVSDSVREKIEKIKTCTRLLEFQINDILDFSDICSKRFTLQKSLFKIIPELKSCLDLIRIQAEYKNVSLLFEADPYLPEEIFNDKHRLQKIVMNLLTNAIKYTSSGFIKLSLSRKAEFIEISVKDTGIGISSSKLHSIFDMCSDDSSARTSGMGLFICKRILKFFNSSFSLSSEEGKGSIFSFMVHFKDKNHETDFFSESMENCTRFLNYYQFGIEEHPKLLIVDDNEFNRMLLTVVFKKKGILYEEAANGLEAVEAVARADKTGNNIKCIIMDCNMPIMDGWEASKKINQMYKDGTIKYLPAILAHSAYSSDEDKKMCFESGMIDYIMKPSTSDEIISKVVKYIT